MSVVCRSSATAVVFCAVAVLALLVGCTRHAATEIILRVDSDIGSALTAVHVRLDRGDDASAFHDVDYSLVAGQHPLPGTIGIAPASPNDGRPLRVVVTAEFADTSADFTVRALVAFQAEHTLALDVFLAQECRVASVRAACEARGQTCSHGGNCIPIERSLLPDVRDRGMAGSDAADVGSLDGDAVPGDAADASTGRDAVDVSGDAGSLCSASSGCDSGTVCNGSACVVCGGNGQPCCAGGTCGMGTACALGQCVCGLDGTPCCGGSECFSQNCQGGTCAPCISLSGACSGGGCCSPNACGSTPLGTVCCSNRDAPCSTANDCCGSQWCCNVGGGVMHCRNGGTCG